MKSRLAPLPLAVALAAVTYIALTLVFWRLNPPQEFGDTYRYFGSRLFDIQNPGITPVWVYTTLVDPWRVTFVQTVLSALAWLTFAWTINRRITQPVLAWLLPVLVLLVSLTPVMWSWNTFLSSESLSFTATVLWMSAVVAFTKPTTRAWSTTLAVFAAGALVIVTRPAVAVIVFPVTLLIVWWQWQSARATLPAAVTFIGAVASTGYGLVRLLLLSSDSTYRYRYAINNYVDKTSSFRAHADANMPQCDPLVAAVNGPAPWDEVWVLKEQLISVCPESFLWLQSGETSAASWVPAVPVDAVTNFIGSMSGVTLFAYGAGRALPDTASNLVLPDLPWWILVSASIVIGALLVAFSRVPVPSPAFLVVSLLVITSSVAAYCFAVWAADGIELARHLLPVTALLPVAAITLPITLLSTPDPKTQPMLESPERQSAV